MELHNKVQEGAGGFLARGGFNVHLRIGVQESWGLKHPFTWTLLSYSRLDPSLTIGLSN